MIKELLIAILEMALGAFCYRWAVAPLPEPKVSPKLPKCLVVSYAVPDGGSVSVRACACQSCKNVMWAQGVEIQPPIFCAYCGQKFTGISVTEDGDFSKFIVTD